METTEIIIKTIWEETMDGLDEVEVTTGIYCTECGHEFDTYDYDNMMVEDMKIIVRSVEKRLEE